jgi:hypothetical protein
MPGSARLAPLARKTGTHVHPSYWVPRITCARPSKTVHRTAAFINSLPLKQSSSKGGF